MRRATVPYNRPVAHVSRRAGLCLGLLAGLAATPAAADDALLEFHFKPVPDLQIAIWLETPEGEFIKDVYVTQATGKLGIGNRSGVWNFLSSWHAPYGPRKNVLPIWGHRRGKTYPAIVFHDSNPGTQTSLGFHEGTSSFESYYCRPLKPSENDAIIDAMSCPSPQTFQSDKGRFSDDESVYPPRNDLVEFEEGDDHPDILMYEELNDLDSVTGATPAGNAATLETVKITEAEAQNGPIVAWIEVSLEHDENDDWDFDRAADHFVDTKLPDYGVEWLGQPSIVYRVELDPAAKGFTGTDDYEGYSDLEGDSGVINPPDSTISTANGSGADRLQQLDDFGDIFRFGVYSHGYGGGGGDDGGDTGEDGGSDDEGGSCSSTDLPAPEDVEIEALEFDRVSIDFRLPESIPAGSEVERVSVALQPSREPLDAETILRGRVEEFTICPPGETNCDVEAGPGDDVHIEVAELFGDFTYQFAIKYEDRCTNESVPTLGSATTPVQQFQQIDTFCFVATAAYGANWASEVGALRAFRDVVLKRHALGRQAISYYYAYGPSLARIVASSAYLRASTRAFLQPIADASKPLKYWSH